MKLYRCEGLVALVAWRLCIAVYWRFGITFAVTLGRPVRSWYVGDGFLATRDTSPPQPQPSHKRGQSEGSKPKVDDDR